MQRKKYDIRGYYFGPDRAAFVDVPTVQHITHDFTEPNIDIYFDDPDSDLPEKEEILVLEGMVCFVVYWIVDRRYPVNIELYEQTGILFRGKLLIFKRRANSMRLAYLSRTNLIKALEGIQWSVVFQFNETRN